MILTVDVLFLFFLLLYSCARSRSSPLRCTCTSSPACWAVSRCSWVQAAAMEATSSFPSSPFFSSSSTWAGSRFALRSRSRVVLLFSRSYCYTVWSAIGSGLLSVRPSVCLSVRPSVCDAVHCGSQGWCTRLKVVPKWSWHNCSYLSLLTLFL